MSEPLAFVDLETTGATATADRITEIGIVLVDGDEVRTWSSLINPETRISSFIERLTGISNEMVAGAPAFREIAAEVAAMLSGRLFVAHNARFDQGFLTSEFHRAGMDFRCAALCTVKLSRRLYPQYRKHSLDSLIERHDLAATGRHRALADAKLVHQFWERIHSSFAPEEIREAIRESTSRPLLPEWLDPTLADTLPEGSGVYILRDGNGIPLYVGRGARLRKRILSHFAAGKGEANDEALARQVRSIDWIETEGELGSRLREAALIRQWAPSHNRPAETGVLRRIRPWPFTGPAIIREGADTHVINTWRHLGTARSEAEIDAILAATESGLEPDIYRILQKVQHLMAPLTGRQ